MQLYFKISFLVLLSFFSSVNGTGQNEDGKIRILFIFDGSNSMNAQWGNSSKITIAKQFWHNYTKLIEN
jgi:hypothetical protein